MRRLTPYGSVELPLEDELGQMIALFRGAHACVNRQLALPPSDVLPELWRLKAKSAQVTQRERKRVQLPRSR